MNKNLVTYLIELYRVMSSSDDGDTVIRVDDRYDADRDDIFCDIFVRVSPDHRVTLELHRAPFVWDNIGDWIESHGGTVSGQGSKRMLSLPVTQTDSPLLRALANEFRRLGASIPVQPRVIPTWKYICPRIARSLEPLAQHLEDFCNSQSETAEREQS